MILDAKSTPSSVHGRKLGLLTGDTFLLCRIYDLYCDYVLKNPFYEVEMPIRCELFDTNLFAVINDQHRRWGRIG